MSSILIVDDLEPNRHLLMSVLKAGGHTAKAAANGLEALDMALREPPDLVITDILMPVMDGYSLCRQWRAEPRLSAIPFIFFTATYTDEKDRAFGLSLGANRFLIKPMDAESLLQEVAETIADGADAAARPAGENIHRDDLYLRRHNEALIRKLEDKIRQLEDTNMKLEAEIRLREQVEGHLSRLFAAIEHAAECILIGDRHGVIEYANPVIEDLLDLKRDALIGRRIDDLADRLLADPSVRKKIRARLAEGRMWSDRLEIKVGSGEPISFDATVSPIGQGPDAFDGFVAVLKDVTEHLRLEKQLMQAQKMEAIGTLAGGIAHDFNNILTAIIGYTDLAAFDLPRDHPAADGLRSILNACDRAGSLVEQILTFSRKTEEGHRRLDLRGVVKESLKLLRASLPATIEIRTSLTPSSARVMANATRMQQVILNICTNAAHAMRDAGGALDLDLASIHIDETQPPIHPDLAPGPYHLLTISDTGMGMSAAVLSRIFEPFYTTKAPGEGTGLGLSMAHGIIKSHGGAITVESEVDKGSAFRIYLPAENDAVDPDGEAAAGPTPAGSERVLMVDDEPDLVDIADRMLKRLGYAVTVRTAPFEALTLFRENPDAFDVVITDQTMPRLTGLQLTRELLKIRPDLPIILCTGFSVHVPEEKALAAGVRLLMPKPYVLKDLAGAIRRVMES